MIRVTQGFQLLTREAIDNRIVMTKAEMLAAKDNQMPDNYFCICKDDNLIYVYSKSATPNAETGKFRVYNPATIQNITIDGQLLPIENLTVDIPLSVVNGYYYEGEFYADSNHREKYVGFTWKMYIDIPTSMVYVYTGSGYRTVSVPVPFATDSIPGISKLYGTPGNNSDGSIRQDVITLELNKKFEIEHGEDETLILYSNENS